MKQKDPDRGTHRVEGFSDAFFAIVITLLALDLRLPEHHSGALSAQFSALWPVAAAYLISFINIYIAHHELMRIATRADTRFLYLNGALLLGIGIMPFSTAVLADFIGKHDAPYAAALYTGVFLWVSVFLFILWRYLAGHPDRLMSNVTRRDRRRISRTYAIAIALYLIAFASSWIAPMFSVMITLALAVFFAVADRISGFASEDVADEPTESSLDSGGQGRKEAR